MSEPFRAHCKVWLFLVCLKVTALLIAAMGCQQAPTKITQTAEVEADMLVRNARASDVRISDRTILIDARPAFDYGLAHTPGAINLQWQDFARPNTDVPGRLPADLDALAKRLSLHGITPLSQVVVIGKGKHGLGEEGRVAWTLVHLGVRDVQIVGQDYFRAGMVNAEPAQRENAEEWKPELNPKMVADRAEVMKLASTKVAEGEREKVHILDVRTRKEYFLKADQGYVFPDLRALHIDWQEFVTDQGRPNFAIRGQLEAMGWKLDDRIVVISNKGVRSGAAAFALASMGFTNVANYTGGFTELMLKAPKSGKGPKERPPGK